MGDPEPKERRSGGGLGRCCCLFFLLIGVLILGTLGYAFISYRSMRQTQPLAFEPIDRTQLEEGLLTAKFRLNELPSRVLGGDTVVRLGERELNTLLFARAEHTADDKARVTLEDTSLWFEASKKLEGGDYLNVRVNVQIVLAPQQPPQIRVLGGQIGGFTLGPVTRSMLEGTVQKALEQATQRDDRLTRAVGFEVRNSEAHIRYPPEAVDEIRAEERKKRGLPDPLEGRRRKR